MFRTFMTTFIVAGIIIIFVIARFLGIDSDTPSKKVSTDNTHKFESVYETWVTFTPDNKSFTVKFPRQPEHIAENSRDSLDRYFKHYEIFAASGLDSAAYMIQEITFKGEASPTKDPSILKNSLSDILASTQSNLLQKTEDKKFMENDALYFEIENGDNYITGIMFVQNKSLFILSRTVDEDDKSIQEDYDFFLNSFKINEPSNSSKGSKQKENQ